MPHQTFRHSKTATHWDDVIRPVAAPPAMQQRIAKLAEDLRRKNASALGFLPDHTYLEAIQRDRLVCTLENDEPCGILLWGKRKGRIKIHQTVIAHDSRRLLHATHAVEAIVQHPDASDANMIQLRCATDLPAIKFWMAIGMRRIYTVKGKLWKGREIAVLTLSIAQHKAWKRKMMMRLLDLAIANPEL